MLVKLTDACRPSDLEAILEALRGEGWEPRHRGRIVVVPVESGRVAHALAGLDGIESIDPQPTDYKLVARDACPEGSRVVAGGVEIGGRELIVIAGPCAVESAEQVEEVAVAVASVGARMLRGGAFKPRTSPYAFQGLGVEGLELLALARQRSGLPVVTEVLAPEEVPLADELADMLQVGARSMQNFPLLKALGRGRQPVLLKRGQGSTVDELLLAAEYIVFHGNPHVVLCERGIRTFETTTRNTLDMGAVAALKALTHLPVIVDPSHAAGRSDLVPAIAKAACAAGADGLLVEVHPSPATARSDGAQALDPSEFAALMRDLAAIAVLCGRSMAASRPGAQAAELARLRAHIDAIDAAVASLLSERFRIVLDVARVKDALGLSLHSPEREQAVLERVARLVEPPLEPEAARVVFEAIVEQARLVAARRGAPAPRDGSPVGPTPRP